MTAAGPERLVHMANQIADFFASQGGETAAAAAVADHLAKFWDPRMRAALLAHAAGGGQGLKPIVLKAVEGLKAGRQEQIP